MYRQRIEIKKDVPKDTVREMLRTAEKEFSNRAGTAENISTDPYCFMFVGEEKEYCCLSLGMLALWHNKEFVSRVKDWQWLDDEDPEENCDVIKELSIPVR